jgi:perosamine synthetase
LTLKKKTNVFEHSKINVPAFLPWISTEDKKSVMNALKKTMLTLGPNVETFEENFAKFTGSKYAVAVSSCTAALHISTLALGIGKGDEVIIPDLTFIADANAVLAAGATPKIVDIDSNYSISLDSIKQNITKKTKAIIPVHIYGQASNMKELVEFANSKNLMIVEDCAHALDTFYNKKHVGNYGLTGCFSFYPTKNMTTAEGGMVITNNKQIAERLKRLRNHGMTKSLSSRYEDKQPWIFDVVEPGLNYRLDEIRSALGISQLKRIHKITSLRKKAAKYYTDNLKIKGIITPEIFNDKSHSYHLYTIRVTKDYGISRNKLFEIFKKHGIRTTVYWQPLHEFSAYKKFVSKKSVINSTKLYNEILSLPLYPNIPVSHQKLVIKCIKKYQFST